MTRKVRPQALGARNRRPPKGLGGAATPTSDPAFDGLDGALIDGLEFCRRVYDLFDKLRAAPGGVSNVRTLRSKTEKRVIEELLPIARYVQLHYREGRRIKVRWLSGSQPYDAILWSSGGYVKHQLAPRRVLIEVTTAVHDKEYLSRQLVDSGGVSFGPKGTRRNKKTGVIESSPHVTINDEIASDLAKQMIDCLARKSGKQYPAGTVLIIRCVTNGVTLEDEWQNAVKLAGQQGLHNAFREVFLFNPVTLDSATLIGRRRRRR